MINVNEYTSFVSSRELLSLLDTGYKLVGDLKHILNKSKLVVHEDIEDIYLIEIYIDRRNRYIDIFSTNLLSSLYAVKDVYKIFNSGGFV